MSNELLTNWDGLLWELMIQGVAAKIQRGEPLTASQQALKDGAPSGFEWPDPSSQPISG